MSVRYLSSRAVACLRALVDTVTPNPALGDAPSPEEIVDFVDSYVPYLPKDLRLLLPLGLVAFDFLAVLWFGHRFSRSSAEERERYARAWFDSPWRLAREMMKGLTGLALLSYYSDPRVGRSFGYQPESWIAQVKARRLALHGDDIRAEETAHHGFDS